MKVGQIFREQIASRIKEGVENRSNTFMISYNGLSSKKMSQLRKGLKGKNAQFFVSRKRIAQIALKGLQREELGKNLDGQAGFVWSDSDAAEISKLLVEFAKGCEGFDVQAGLLDGSVLSKNDIERLSSLPSRDQLLAQLLGTIQAPLTRLAGALNGKTRDLLSVLKQLSEQKGGN